MVEGFGYRIFYFFGRYLGRGYYVLGVIFGVGNIVMYERLLFLGSLYIRGNKE